MTKVKICGITNLDDALLSAKFGADALGFNFYPKSSRYISPEKAREIIEQLPKEVLKVGVFVNENLEKISEIASIAKLDAIQLHGEETPEYARELKAKANLEIIKAFRVSPEFKPEDVLQYEVDAVLLDAYSPKEHGGTGETFDWEIARKVQEIFPQMYLAGGLSKENVNRAIKIVQPFAIDACSLIEKEKGRKNVLKTQSFLRTVKDSDTKENPFDWNLERESLTDKRKLLPKWEKAINAFETRISNRYFETIEYLIKKEGKSRGEGFSILTLECSLIEFLATLRDGMIFRYETNNSKNYYYSRSARWYNKFLQSADIFKGYFYGAGAFLTSNEFYKDVRCALIHEARTRKGWTVNIYEKDKKKDQLNKILFEGKKIYRTALNKALADNFREFCEEAREESKKGRKYRKYIARKLDVIYEIEPDNCFWW